MQRATVLLLFGGESSEHDVSVSSARNVYAAIDDEKYDVLLGYIDHQGKWWLLDSFAAQIDTHGAPQLLPALGGGGFVTLPDNRVVCPQVILPILHGKNGEDGSVQGLAQLAHIPIAGADMPASVVAMDKLVCKQLVATRFPVVPYQVHRETDPIPDFSKLSMTLGSPLFVKPIRSGSSAGVTKVYSEEELARALEEAHQHDSVALIEQAVVARELEVGILGSAPNVQATGVGEVIPGEEFYTYSAKYSNTDTKIVIPAEIDPELARDIRSRAENIYELLGCNGLARIDFFLADNGTLYFNELNTLPGFTNMSMYPKLWRQQGLGYQQLVERLLDDALGHATIKAAKTEGE